MRCPASLRYPHNLGEQHIKARCEVNLLGCRQRFALANLSMQMAVSHFLGGAVEVFHCFPERFRARVVVGDFAKVLFSEQRRDVIDQRARERRGRKPSCGWTVLRWC